MKTEILCRFSYPVHHWTFRPGYPVAWWHGPMRVGHGGDGGGVMLAVGLLLVVGIAVVLIRSISPNDRR